MKSKKIMLILITAIFLASIAGVCAADANDTLVASENTNQIELSDSDKVIEDNLQTSEENDELTLTDNDVLGADSATYSDLDSEIRASENVTLTHKNYIYDDGATAITITEDNKVIDGNGAIIDMTGSTIRAFTVSASGVTIKNLTIKNANYNGDGGAIYFSSSGTVTNCNFTNNNATGEISCGGAVYFSGTGNVTNCNFTGNIASSGGAIYFQSNGNVTNCNFTNNQATGTNSWGGAIIFGGSGTVTNCNFTDNKATGAYSYGGAISMSFGSVTNCNFINNQAGGGGGAIFFSNTGTVTNCNFTNNTATEDGGAICMSSGSVTNCNFTNNIASNCGGAVFILSKGTATNCNFTNNAAHYGDGGAIWMSSGNVTNCNFDGNEAGYCGGAIYFSQSSSVINCNFANNRNNEGGAIYSYSWYTAADTCIFKTESDTTNDNVIIVSPTLNVDNFTTFYKSDEKLTFNLTTNSGMPVDNGNISISVYYKNNDSWFGNYSCLSGEGWAVDLPVGSYYAVFDTEYAGFNAIKRTIKVIPDIPYYANVTPVTANNKTVNITAKSNIPQDIIEGKLLFILPNGTQIEATYGDNGIWWAEHTFDAYGEYKINATYVGLDNVTINNGTITINKVNSTITLDNIVLDYGESRNVTVATQGAVGITADINGINVTVINNYTIQIADLAAGNYTLTVTTIPDGDHNPVTRNATVTVNRAKTELTADAIITTYSVSKDLVITLKDSNGNPIGGLNITVDLNGTKNYTTDTNGQVRIPTNGLAANIYDVLISFNGTDNYLNSSNTTTVSINKESSRADTKPLTTDYNVHKYLVVGLKDNEGNPIRNADASIEIHGVTYKCRSDDAGDARLIIRLNPGTYTAKITFDNVNYTGFTQYVTVIVKKLTPKLTAKKKTFKKSKKVKKYTVTLKANSKALAKVKLTLKVKGKTYKAKTNSKGKATFKIKNIKKKGKYRATVKFAGNTYYNKVTKKVKITVK